MDEKVSEIEGKTLIRVGYVDPQTGVFTTVRHFIHDDQIDHLMEFLEEMASAP